MSALPISTHIPLRRLRWAVLTLGLLVLLATFAPVSSQEVTPESTPAYIDNPEALWDGTLRRIRVPILMYHYVSPLPDNADDIRRGLSVSPDQFRAHVEYLFYQGYSTISMYDLDDALLRGKPLPPKPVILTFDDGYIDHYTNVFPVLRSQAFTGTFFIITSRPDAHDPEYMSWDQIREMAGAGMSMESHTKTHSELDGGRSYDFLVYEMLGSMESLRAYTGRQPHMFAYPVGRYDAAALAVARTLPIWRAVTTHDGRYHTTDNRLELDRVRIPGNLGVPGLASILNDD
jgi:peptidoglycan/xylan/chitin deacetylase (PgdA/CDA1 family)